MKICDVGKDYTSRPANFAELREGSYFYSGKTTNVRKLHELIPTKLDSNLTTLDTDGERTLFFDYFPIKAGAIGRYKLKLQILSVPGQIPYRTTRKRVLQNADGVVFVADSQASEIEHNSG